MLIIVKFLSSKNLAHNLIFHLEFAHPVVWASTPASTGVRESTTNPRCFQTRRFERPFLTSPFSAAASSVEASHPLRAKVYGNNAEGSR
jgi:hypothetical protein